MSLASRLKQVRKDKELSQQQLANLSSVHISNIGRYERGDAQPSAEVLNRIAGVLEVSPDFLINGTIEDKAESSLSDNDLLNQFRKVEKLPDDKKRLVKEFLDAFLFKYNIQQQIIAS
jgi:transcriptional regulator with XRE-family HTH domain